MVKLDETRMKLGETRMKLDETRMKLDETSMRPIKGSVDGKRDGGLPDGVRYRFSQELEITDDPLRVGFVSKDLAYGHWYTQTHCHCEWTVGSTCPNQEKRGDFVPFEKCDWNSLLADKPVDLVVFIGCRPEKNHCIWQCQDISMIIWIVDSTASRRRGMTSPTTWEIETHQILHSFLGGVTTGDFRVTCARSRQPKRAIPWNWTYNKFQNNLAQVQISIAPGAPAKISTVLKKGTMNTPFGLLEWKNRNGMVYSKSVFLEKQGKWVRRHLSPKELMDSMDIPAAVSYHTADEDSAEILKVPIPGKVISLALGLARSSAAEAVIDNSAPEGIPSGFPPQVSPQESSFVAQEGSTTHEGPMSSYDLLVAQVAETISAKATKSDDSDVPDYIWNKFLIDGAPQFFGNTLRNEKGDTMERPARSAFLKIVAWLRRRMLSHWKRKVIKEMVRWHRCYGIHISEKRIVLKRMREVAYHVGWCSWWNWDRGSTLFFWRWPLMYMSDALFGVPPRFDSTPPQYWTPQPPYTDETTRQLVKDKLQRVLMRGYVQRTHKDALKGLMFMFDVPKGESDIRMVYDGTKSGLNQSLWSPWFRLPTAEALFEVVMPGYWCTDNDYGDFFLNFPMHEDLKTYCGVDLTQLFTQEEIEALDVFDSFLDEELDKDDKDQVKTALILAVWERMAMGLKTSPYVCVQFAGRSNRMILGSRNDPANPFEWSEVRLNLPGTEGYNSNMPWIYKARDNGLIATDLVRFVDDLRNSGATETLAWEASTRIGKISSWYGQQDAHRKRRTPSRNPGAWAATVIATDDGKLEKYVTQEAWEKAQKRIRYLAYYAGCDVDKSTVDFSIERDLKIRPKEVGFLIHKIAEKYVGYLVHISATYDAIFPYLCGLYMTMNRWRPGRDEDGWRDLMWFRLFRERRKPQHEKPPKWVECYPRVKEDMRVLMDFFSGSTPPKIPIRPTGYATFYIVGDASGTGFGTTTWDDKSGKVRIQFGGWDDAFQLNSSNLREAYNHVLGLEDQIKSGVIKSGTEVFVFTDNSTTESVFTKGSSKSKLLHELAIRLRKLQMEGHIFIHIIWIAGKRMIAQGTDSVSRGDFCSGVLAGDPFLAHIPLSQSAFQRNPTLLDWFKEYLPGSRWQFLSPAEWYTLPFEDPYGRYVWCPPPALANKAVELMCEVHHIHPYTSHVFVCPTLMTSRWRKTLMKCSDAVFTITAGCPLWPFDMFEPLTFGFVSPLCNSSPWRMGRTEWLAQRQTQMHGMLAADPGSAGNCMRQFWDEAKRVRGSMPTCLAREVLLSGEGRWVPCPGGPRFGGFDH